MNRNSLAAVSISNRLSELHDVHRNGNKSGPNQVIYTHPSLDMRFIGRYCTIKGERSGGYALKACIEERYAHDTGLKIWVTKRLKPGWTPVQKQRAIHRMIHALAEQRTMGRLREQVFILAESRNLDLNQIDQMAEAEGREICYLNMSVADCAFWQIELEKQPMKVTP